MTAKPSDLGRIQEIFDVVTQTQNQMSELGFSCERFMYRKAASHNGCRYLPRRSVRLRVKRSRSSSVKAAGPRVRPPARRTFFSS